MRRVGAGAPLASAIVTPRDSSRAASAPPACPLCGGRASALHRLSHTTAWQCEAADCRLRFAAPQMSDADLRAAYRALYYPADGQRPAVACEGTPSEIHRELVGYLIAKLGDASPVRMLDYGCGNGALAGVAREFGLSVSGIESDPEARASASLQWRIPVFEDLAQLRRAEPDARFDAILVWQVIEHLREPWADLAELRDLLAPTGVLVVATPNAHCLKARLQRASWANVVNPTHLYYFASASLAKLARQCGLEVADRIHLPAAYPHHGAARRWLQRRLRAWQLDGDLLFILRSPS